MSSSFSALFICLFIVCVCLHILVPYLENPVLERFYGFIYGTKGCGFKV